VVYVSIAHLQQRLRTKLTHEFLDLAVAWEALLGFDSLIFILTLLKTYRVRPRHHFMLQKRINIVSLVLRDGGSIMNPCMTYNLFFELL
jgi:hypothetical protein